MLSCLSTSESVLEMKKDATEEVFETSPVQFSSPLIKASITFSYLSTEKSNVTLTEIPSEIICLIAGKPS